MLIKQLLNSSCIKSLPYHIHVSHNVAFLHSAFQTGCIIWRILVNDTDGYNLNNVKYIKKVKKKRKSQMLFLVQNGSMTSFVISFPTQNLVKKRII